MSQSAAPPDARVVVAVLTFRRPRELARILPLLSAQVAERGSLGRVLVIDNDPAAGARDFAGQFSDRHVDYVHEARPGIASARNRALAEAANDDLLVFIDDDEEPTPGWLASIIAGWESDHATAVTGPVVAAFDVAPSAWVVASRMFDTRHNHDRASLHTAASNNLLLDMTQVRTLRLSFNEEFALTGGEDTEFSRRLITQGGRIQWCEKAVVIDHIPADRTTARWVLRREFRSGTSFARMEVGLATPRRRPAIRALLLAKAVARVATGLGQLALGTVSRSVHHRARGACLLSSNVGLAGGAFGYVYGEYRRAEGSSPSRVTVDEGLPSS